MTSSFGPGISPKMPQCTGRRRPSGKSDLAVDRERDRTMTRHLPHAESEPIYGLFSAPRISTFSAPQTAIFTPKTVSFAPSAPPAVATGRTGVRSSAWRSRPEFDTSNIQTPKLCLIACGASNQAASCTAAKHMQKSCRSVVASTVDQYVAFPRIRSYRSRSILDDALARGPPTLTLKQQVEGLAPAGFTDRTVLRYVRRARS